MKYTIKSSANEILESRLIYWAIIGSCLVHLIVLAVAYYVIPRSVSLKTKSMELVYHSKSKPKAVESRAKIESVADLKKSRERFQENSPARMIEKQLSGTGVMRESKGDAASKVDIADKQPLRLPDMMGKRSITVPVLSAGRITNPQYLSYNDRIRDKIRNRAYFYIDDPSFQAGEVYLTFVVMADGSLKDLQVIDERSQANEYLRSIGLRSIKESSPFPPFPPELKYPELSFNVVISFEVSEQGKN